jgi:hypothetical protein
VIDFDHSNKANELRSRHRTGGEKMKKWFPYIVFFAFAFIGTVLVGEWGLLIGIIIGTLFLIYQELQKITSLLSDKATKNEAG